MFSINMSFAMSMHKVNKEEIITEVQVHTQNVSSREEKWRAEGWHLLCLIVYFRRIITYVYSQVAISTKSFSMYRVALFDTQGIK